MPSYSSYKRQMSVLDKDDDIVSWITVKGNHIPIRKGQSKEDAVKSFIEAKSKGDGGKHYITTKKHGDTRYVNPKNYEIVKTKEGIKPFGSKVEAQSFAYKLNHTDPYAGTPFAVKNYERKQFPYEVESEEKVELTDLQGNKYTTTKQELKEAGTSKFGLDPKGIKPAILEPKKVDKAKSGGKVYNKTISKVRQFKAKTDGTYDFETGKPKDYSKGFSVSFHQNEPDKDGKWKSDYGRYTDEDYDKAVENMVKETGGELNIGYFSGTPEVSVWVEDVFKAVKFAIDNNQHSIWDWENGDVLINPYYDPKKNPMKE